MSNFWQLHRFSSVLLYLSTLLLGLSLSVAANAGAIYQIECEDAHGRQSTYRVPIGGGMNFNEITGFCQSRKGYVYHYWSHEQTPPPSTGSGDELRFSLPDCPEPIKPITSSKQLLYCPKDSGEVKRVRRTAMYD